MSKRRIVSLFLAAVILATSPVIPVCAKTPPVVVSPMWNNTQLARANISASGTTLTASAIVQAGNINYSCSGTLYVDVWEGGQWVNVKSWAVSGKGSIYASKTYTGTKWKTYRSRLSVSVAGESINAYSSSVTVQ